MKKFYFLFVLLLLFVSFSNSQVKKYFYTGIFDSIPSPHGVTIDPNGVIWYGSNMDSVGIRAIRSNGIPMSFSPIYNVTVSGKTYNIAKDLRGITTDNNGNIIVAIGSQLLRINYKDGTGMTYKKFSGSLAKPSVDKNGRIYVTKVVGPSVFWILNSNFDSVGIVESATSVWTRAIEVSKDGKDVYVGSLWHHVIQHYHSDDLSKYVLKDTLSGVLEGDTPGLNFDPEGKLWVAEYQSGRGFDKYFIYDLNTKKRDSLMGFDENLILSPRGVAFSSSGDTAYITSFDGGVIQKWTRSTIRNASIDNFESKTSTSQWGTKWAIFKDTDAKTWSVPGTADSICKAGGANGTAYCAYMKGACFGWGLGLLLEFDPQAIPVNLTQFKGMTFYAKGAQKQIRLVIREGKRFDDGTFDFYNYAFTPTQNWTKYELIFPNDLTQMWDDPASKSPFTMEDITGIDFRPFKTKDTIEFYVDEIKFLPFITSVKGNDNVVRIPGEFILKQNYPNPFNPSTSIEYTLSAPKNVRIEIFNMLGQRVKILVDEFKTAGVHNVNWNGKDFSGRNVSSGVYFYSLVIDNLTQIKKMVLLK